MSHGYSDRCLSAEKGSAKVRGFIPRALTVSETKIRFISSSSITTTLRFAGTPRGANEVEGTKLCSTIELENGMEMVNDVPTPGLLSTCMLPFCISTKRLTMASPRPVPPNRRAMPESACVKSLKMVSNSLSDMPMPVSLTSIISSTFSVPPFC